MTEQFLKQCGCRSAGECTHNLFAEQEALDHLVDEMAKALKKKLRKKSRDGKSGWDSDDWPVEDMKRQLIERAYHDYGNQALDVIAFAMFWWNRTSDEGVQQDQDLDPRCSRQETYACNNAVCHLTGIHTDSCRAKYGRT